MKFDLGVFQEDTFDLEMNGELICSVKKPTKKLLVMIESTEKKLLDKECSIIDKMDSMEGAILAIFNHNKQDKKFTREDVEKYDFQVQIKIYQAYFGWCYQVLSNPN